MHSQGKVLLNIFKHPLFKALFFYFTLLEGDPVQVLCLIYYSISLTSLVGFFYTFHGIYSFTNLANFYIIFVVSLGFYLVTLLSLHVNTCLFLSSKQLAGIRSNSKVLSLLSNTEELLFCLFFVRFLFEVINDLIKLVLAEFIVDRFLQ